MKNPECGDCGGCPGAANCPLIASRREKVPGLSVLTSGVGKIIDFQTRKIISTHDIVSGGPAPEVPKESRCTCGFCSECRKKKIAA